MDDECTYAFYLGNEFVTNWINIIKSLKMDK